MCFPRIPPAPFNSATARVAPFRPDNAKVAVGPVNAPKKPTWIPSAPGLFSPPQLAKERIPASARRGIGERRPNTRGL